MWYETEAPQKEQDKLAPKEAIRSFDEIIGGLDEKEARFEAQRCLSCGNCCKKMTPTFTPADIKRIAGHFSMTPDAFKDKWLTFEKKEGDWQNVKQPCQFLNLTDNKCSIYPIRPADCAGFPHLTKKNPTDYLHVHKQNIEYCPATYKMVEKMMDRMKK